MSRLFEKFIEEVFGSNPHLHAEAKRIEAESKESQWYDARQKCNPLDNTIEEWNALGKPNKKNQTLKCDSLNHIFGNPVEELDELINQTFNK
jgi:hypothetical protein|tara:strand:+ start:176 stop:451 length:276 start_codon:yes stop_codon:yes gene_type:complete